jgi:hypothetical protein
MSGISAPNPLRRPRRARPPIARTAAVIIAAAALALPAAACGGSPPSQGSPSSTGTGGASSALVTHALAFARCMRAHGVPKFLDPPPSFNGKFPGSSPQQLGVSVSRLRAVTGACQNLLPAGQAPLTAQDRQDYLKAAACMRAHGVPRFPDPAFSGGGVHFPIPPGIDTSSARFTQARQTCARRIPAGLPYSGSGG